MGVKATQLSVFGPLTSRISKTVKYFNKNLNQAQVDICKQTEQ